MKFNKVAKLLKEDLPEKYSDLAEKLLGSLNQLIDQTNRLTNKEVTTADNLKAQKFEFTCTGTDISNGLNFKWNLNEKPTLFIIGGIYEENVGNILQPSFLLWVYKNEDSTVKFTLTGLTAATKYTITIVGMV